MKLTNPLVSVVIPIYNHEKYIQETIESIINQTYQNIELLIIDDGSKDNSFEVVERMTEKCKKRFIRFEFIRRGNKGLTVTLNEGAQWSRGEYFCGLASDDVVMPEKIAKQVQALNENSDIVAVFSSADLIDENSKKLKKRYAFPFNRFFSFQDILLHRHLLPASTQLLRLEAVKKSGGYPQGIMIEDWYMWLCLTKEGKKILKLSDVLASYRVHGNNFSSNYKIMHEGRLEILARLKLNKNQLAVSNCFIASSNEALNTSLDDSIYYLITALKINLSSFFQVRMQLLILRVLTKKILMSIRK